MKKTRSSPPRSLRARSASSPTASRSSDSSRASPSSKSRRSPLATLSRIASSVLSTAIAMSAGAVHHREREGLELLSVRLAAQVRARLGGVLEGRRARALERIGRRDANERALEQPSRERRPDCLVLLRGVEKGHRGSAFAKVRARDL